MDDFETKWKEKLDRLKSEHLDLLRESLAKGMYFRRERHWKVFSWASSVFAALIVGLLIKGGNALHYNILLLIFFVITATLLLYIAIGRIQHDTDQVYFRTKLIKEIDRKKSYWIGDLEKEFNPKKFKVSDRVTLFILYTILMSIALLSFIGKNP